MSLRSQIRRLQQHAQGKLRLARIRQLQGAYGRHRLLLAQWQADEARAQAWREECAARTCRECGQERRYTPPGHCEACGQSSCSCPPLRRRTPRCCLAVCTDLALRALLRRLAGLNPVGPYDRLTRDEWFDALRGAHGPRGCGPSAWDNAVHALEEDR